MTAADIYFENFIPGREFRTDGITVTDFAMAWTAAVPCQRRGGQDVDLRRSDRERLHTMAPRSGSSPRPALAACS